MRRGIVIVENPLVTPEFRCFPPIWEHQGLYSVHICICPLCSWLPTSWVILHIFSTFLNCLCYSKTLDFFIAYSPKVSVNITNVSLALLPIFTQNFMCIRCPRFLSLIFPPTTHHGHILLPLLLGNGWLIRPVAHVNASWNMSKHALVHEFAWLNTPATRCGHSRNYIVVPCTNGFLVIVRISLDDINSFISICNWDTAY
jgi:hypothetical protein